MKDYNIEELEKAVLAKESEVKGNELIEKAKTLGLDIEQFKVGKPNEEVEKPITVKKPEDAEVQKENEKSSLNSSVELATAIGKALKDVLGDVKKDEPKEKTIVYT